MRDVVVTSPKLGNLTCDASTVMAATNLTCLGNYTATQADIDGWDSIYISAFASTPSLPVGNQVVWSNAKTVEVVKDYQMEVDILGVNCTTSNNIGKWSALMR